MANEKFEITLEEIFPQGEMMLVDPVEFSGEQISKGGIIMPGNAMQATPTLARVVRAGNDAKFKEGSVVIFRRYSLDEIKIKTSSGDKMLNFVSNEDIISEYRPK
jgi:co-chaperonin GroES (HSP10)